MNIVIVGTHQFPTPSPAHTGHIVYLDLARALVELGHTVQMIAPADTDFPSVLEMPCSHGQSEPTAEWCEGVALGTHREALEAADVIHDWSVEKRIADKYPGKSVATLMSGQFDRPLSGRNVVVWTQEMRDRALRGESDYHGTEFRQWESMSRPLKDARVVAGGVDTEFWTPGPVNLREQHILWLGRWHEARGYRLAIDVARNEPGLELVMCGEAPGDATNSHQAECALDAVNYATGLKNVTFEWLPKAGHREAVRAQYRRARGFLFTPRFREPFGLSQAEALACGTPVVGLRMGSVPEVIEHGVTGLVVSGAFLGPACRKIQNIDPARCREEAVRRFDRRVMAENYVACYRAALEGGWG